MRAACITFVLLFAGFLFADSRLPDACKLMTAQDVEKVVGAGFNLSPFHGTDSDNSNCGYLKDKDNVVNLMVVNAGTADIVSALKQLQKQYSANGVKVTPVNGAGDGAFCSDSPNVVTGLRNVTLHFGKGPWHAVLDVRINGKPDADAEQKLATVAFGRFP